jgi:hypothetical protein
MEGLQKIKELMIWQSAVISHKNKKAANISH